MAPHDQHINTQLLCHLANYIPWIPMLYSCLHLDLLEGQICQDKKLNKKLYDFQFKKKKTYLFLIKIKNKKLKFKNFSPTKPLKTIIWEIKLNKIK